MAQLRNTRRLTQTQLANTLGVSQAQVSRIENQADLYLSTLRSYIQAMGGELQLRAVFPDGQATALTVAELLEPAEDELHHASRTPEVDIHTAFVYVHRDVARYDILDEGFRRSPEGTDGAC